MKKLNIFNLKKIHLKKDNTFLLILFLGIAIFTFSNCVNNPESKELTENSSKLRGPEDNILNTVDTTAFLYSNENIYHQVVEEMFPLGNSGLFIEMVRIPKGDFYMGAPGTQGAGDDESPAHRVIIENDFWIGKYEITQEQWSAIMANKIFSFPGVKHPADNTSWFDAKSLVQNLNAFSDDNPWRLPSEAEWEYASRAGEYKSRFWYGNDTDYIVTKNYAWTKINANGRTHSVGTTRGGKPNPYGIWGKCLGVV